MAMSNEDLIESYINFYQHSPQSQNTRRSSLRYFFGKDHFKYNGPIFEITTTDLKNYFVWLKNLPGLSIATKKVKWAILTSFLNFVMEDHEEFLVKIPSRSVNSV